jgi:hypothetical protein
MSESRDDPFRDPSYAEMVWASLFKGWNVMRRESVCGNAFEVLLHGMRMLVGLAGGITIRALIAITAPVSAIFALKLQRKYNAEFRQQVRESIARRNGKTYQGEISADSAGPSA